MKTISNFQAAISLPQLLLQTSLCSLLLMVCLSIQAQTNSAPELPMNNNDILATARKFFVDNFCIKKGGFGVIGPEPLLHVVIRSDKNELVLPDNTHWTGQDKAIHQLVCFFDGKIYDPVNVKNKNNFSLADSLLVSFEGDKVYFFNFKTFHGGYYER